MRWDVSRRSKTTRVAGRVFTVERLEDRFVMDSALGDFALAEGEAAAEAQPDFALVDVNPASQTHNQPVSPRDYLDQTSGWYFTHST